MGARAWHAGPLRGRLVTLPHQPRGQPTAHHHGGGAARGVGPGRKVTPVVRHSGMGGKVYIEGRVVDPAQATISVFDRGFLYGDSVFETLRVYRGVPFALEEHLERLFASG